MRQKDKKPIPSVGGAPQLGMQTASNRDVTYSKEEDFEVKGSQDVPRLGTTLIEELLRRGK